MGSGNSPEDSPEGPERSDGVIVIQRLLFSQEVRGVRWGTGNSFFILTSFPKMPWCDRQPDSAVTLGLTNSKSYAKS